MCWEGARYLHSHLGSRRVNNGDQLHKRDNVRNGKNQHNDKNANSVLLRASIIATTQVVTSVEADLIDMNDYYSLNNVDDLEGTKDSTIEEFLMEQ